VKVDSPPHYIIVTGAILTIKTSQEVAPTALIQAADNCYTTTWLLVEKLQFHIQVCFYNYFSSCKLPRNVHLQLKRKHFHPVTVNYNLSPRDRDLRVPEYD